MQARPLVGEKAVEHVGPAARQPRSANDDTNPRPGAGGPTQSRPMRARFAIGMAMTGDATRAHTVSYLNFLDRTGIVADCVQAKPVPCSRTGSPSAPLWRVCNVWISLLPNASCSPRGHVGCEKLAAIQQCGISVIVRLRPAARMSPAWCWREPAAALCHTRGRDSAAALEISAARFVQYQARIRAMLLVADGWKQLNADAVLPNIVAMAHEYPALVLSRCGEIRTLVRERAGHRYALPAGTMVEADIIGSRRPTSGLSGWRLGHVRAGRPGIGSGRPPLCATRWRRSERSPCLLACVLEDPATAEPSRRSARLRRRVRTACRCLRRPATGRP